MTWTLGPALGQVLLLCPHEDRCLTWDIAVAGCPCSWCAEDLSRDRRFGQATHEQWLAQQPAPVGG